VRSINGEHTLVDHSRAGGRRADASVWGTAVINKCSSDSELLRSEDKLRELHLALAAFFHQGSAAASGAEPRTHSWVHSVTAIPLGWPVGPGDTPLAVGAVQPWREQLLQ
jgi:hypothetical protein